MSKFIETEDWRHLYQNEWDKAWFQHNMGYRDFKDLPTRTICCKELRDKAFNITENKNYNGYQRKFASMLTIFQEKVCYTQRNRDKQRNCTSRLLENLKSVRYIFFLKSMLIQQICN